MKSFDAGGRAWEVCINVASVKRVRDRIGLDLLAVLSKEGGNVVERLLTNPVELVDTLYVLCATQAEANGFTEEAFGGMFTGDSIEAATQAFIKELIDFFPPRRRAPLVAMMQKAEAVEAAGVKAAMEQVGRIDPEKLVAEVLARNGLTP